MGENKALRRAAAGAAVAVALGLTALPTASAAPDAGGIRRVSSEADGTQLTTEARGARVSADGRYVAYGVRGPRDGCPLSVSTCVFVKDLRTGRQQQVPGTTRLGGVLQISADGRLVGFITGDGNPRPYIYDRTTGELRLIWPESVPADQERDTSGVVDAISADNRHVLYTISYFHPGFPRVSQVLDRDLVTGTDTVVVAAGTADIVSGAGFSANGRHVAYGVIKDDVYQGLFVKDRKTGGVQRVDTARDGTPGDADSSLVQLSDDGRRIVFDSRSTNLTPDSPAGDTWQAYARDLRTGRIELLGSPGHSALSADRGARFVVLSEPDGLVLLDLRTGKRRTVVSGDATTDPAAVTRDGREVVFTSSEPDLVPGDTNGVPDVFISRIH
ncbi:hypothetical protein SAMN05216489_07051 [Streptomyces sp. 3213]|uniref:hypothetical protein n=1 Tax=Streptomyces sp. 3213.3 TaxID=1855348 RepID=UPI00089B6BDF|nr:hypothetical protein [Streptomyces sp. 3213.3]SEE54464.1 hypothetical protein SAMN05216489_07051 [Streptomyces sp. 3213] [Streptomyces sp. 3213.3]